MITNIIKAIEELGKTEDTPLVERVLKLLEENGELFQAVLRTTEVYQGLFMEDVKESSIDVALISLSIFFQAGGTIEELENASLKKINEW